jgi:PAS domain S-box-containing protein
VRADSQKSSILTKGLALVAIPLICELVFVSGLLYLQSQALKTAREEAEAHHVSVAVHRVIGNVLHSIVVIRGYSLAHLRTSERELNQTFNSQYVALDQLRKLQKGNARALATIDISEKGTRNAQALLADLRTLAANPDADLTDIVKDARKKLDDAGAMMVMPELLQLASDSDKSSDLARQEHAQEQLYTFTFILLLVSSAVTVAVAIYFGREIAGRINEVSNNATKFSMGQPLGPRISGNDEIANLDHVFRSMAALLEEAMVKQRAVFDNASDMICTLDRKLVVTSVNPACKELLGIIDENLTGIRITNLVVEAERTSFAEALSALTAEAVPGRIPAQMLGESGKITDVICSVHWSPSEQSFFCVFHDISEMKAADRLRQEVVAMVTHDIRSPLHAVMNFQEMLSTGSLGELNARGERLLNLAKASNLTINLLVNDLLDSEKLRSGQLSLDKQRFAIKDCIESASQSLAVWAVQRNIAIRIESCDAMAFGDVHRIGQVVTNLLSNAIKFSGKQNSIVVSSRVNGQWLIVAVRDFGPGIPEAEQALIFGRFKQGASNMAHMGAGLGLSICKALVELHDGQIRVDSAPGQGSTFSFRIPYTN